MGRDNGYNDFLTRATRPWVDHCRSFLSVFFFVIALPVLLSIEASDYPYGVLNFFGLPLESVKSLAHAMKKEKSEDIKGIVRSCNSEKDRQYNNEKTNNDL